MGRNTGTSVATIVHATLNVFACEKEVPLTRVWKSYSCVETGTSAGMERLLECRPLCVCVVKNGWKRWMTCGIILFF